MEAPQGTQAVVRALRLLRAFTPSRPELSLKELATGTGLTKTTAHRLLQALESEGLVGRNANRSAYILGPELIALGSQALLTNDLRASVRPTLERLAAQTGEATNLEILVGDHMLILDSVRGSHVISASVEIGTRWPAYATSTGKCVLARLPEDVRSMVLQEPRTRFTPRTLVESDDLEREFEHIREVGFAVANQELEEGYVAIGAEFRNATGDVQGAISIGGPSSRLGLPRTRELGERLREEADLLARVC